MPVKGLSRQDVLFSYPRISKAFSNLTAINRGLLYFVIENLVLRAMSEAVGSAAERFGKKTVARRQNSEWS